MQDCPKLELPPPFRWQTRHCRSQVRLQEATANV